MVMIAIQVIGDDTAVAFAGSQGNFELNAMRPVIINNFLHSATILADGCEKFRRFSVDGTMLDRARIDSYVANSLMLVTALSPVIGYQNAAHIAEKAAAEGTTLRGAALLRQDTRGRIRQDHRPQRDDWQRRRRRVTAAKASERPMQG
jgi:fumarate hydratase class II